MKNLYFFQPNSLLGNSIYFPYAVGVIASYAFQFEDIRQNYHLGGIFFKEDLVPDVLKHLDNPVVVSFSNYFWNYEYNLKIAALIKKLYPACLTVFGGHQVTKDTKWLEKYDFIDLLIHGEGEIPFVQVLRSIINQNDFSGIPNLAFRNADGKIVTTPKQFVGVSDYPSPYTNGIFDHLLNISEELEFNAQLETNRGCPYHCSFCDWCSYDVPMRFFSMEKIKNDLQWISDHKITYCMCVDSNFGIVERDEEIAALAVALKKDTGYPSRFGACFAKNKTDRIFRINKLLNDVGMSKGVSLAFQSMSKVVLQNVSRSNMEKDKLAEQLVMYRKAGIPTYTELILGLPGETYESFCSGICELLDLGQHDAINVFRCEVYPNSDLADETYMKRFGIKTAQNKMNLNHCRIADAVFSGGLDFIVETSSMTMEQLIDAHVFACCVQSMHCRGMLQYCAIYLRHVKGISYYDFYGSLICYFKNHNGLIGSTLQKIKCCINAMSSGEVDFSYINPVFGNITWPYDEAMLLDFIYEKDRFYEEAASFLSVFFSDPEFEKELLRFQKNMIVLPGKNCVEESFHFDFFTYFENLMTKEATVLQQEDCVLRFYSGDAPEHWEEYSRQIIWYGRRNRETIRRVRKV